MSNINRKSNKRDLKNHLWKNCIIQNNLSRTWKMICKLISLFLYLQQMLALSFATSSKIYSLFASCCSTTKHLLQRLIDNKCLTRRVKTCFLTWFQTVLTYKEVRVSKYSTSSTNNQLLETKWRFVFYYFFKTTSNTIFFQQNQNELKSYSSFGCGEFDFIL